MNQPRVVFCDFDGTITAEETFVSMLENFAPKRSAQLLPLIYDRKLTLKEGVKQMLGSIPSPAYEKIIKHIRERAIRPGLPELLDFLDEREIPFVVISGGLRGMVEAVLQRKVANRPLIANVTAIYGADVDTSGAYLRVYSEFEDDTELVAKVKVMAKYSATEAIAIGDSVTDINMALHADLVFARDRLIGYLEAENKPYLKWNNFFDVRDYLKAEG